MSTYNTHQGLLQDIRSCEWEVLQYDATLRLLTTWRWPALSNGDYIPPSSLRLSRVTHNFLGPCCLCPRMSPGKTMFVEASILIALEGPFSGEYVALCAKGHCGYVAPLDRIYSHPELETTRVLPREPDEAPPRPVPHYSEDIDNAFNGEDTDDEGEPDDRGQAVAHSTKRRHAEAFESTDTIDTESPPAKVLIHSTCSDIDVPDFPKFAPQRRPLPRPVNYTASLERLDSKLGPGVPMAEFVKLFAVCNNCFDVTTRRAFVHHKCGDASAM